ncbi:MAG: hypothetical protein HUJ25_04320 [Crocinitomicaceae bacterium]|nr:hypothetical protein [Crocinitomicaceae bacterium]
MLRTARVLLIVVFISSVSYAQKGTHTPYSILGVGELKMNDYAAFLSMGGVSMANTDSTKVNPANPASYVYFGRLRPILQVGMNGRFSRFETTTSTTKQRHFGLNQFQLGIPIKKRWGAALGLKPYSFTGYKISNYTVEDGDSTELYTSEGSGGINKFYLGVAYQPLNFSYIKKKVRKQKDSLGIHLDTFKLSRHHQLSIGANVNYMFGTSERSRTYQFAQYISEYNARVNNGLRISDVMYEFGLNYQLKWGVSNSDGKSLKGNSVSIGASYSPGIRLRAFQDLFAYSYQNFGTMFNGSENIQDTIEYVRDNQGSIYIPTSYKGGIEFRLGPISSSRSSQLRLGIDARYQQWSQYTEDFGSTFDNQLKDRLQLGFGLEWTPVTNKSELFNAPLFSKMQYRMGFTYTMTELQFETSPGNYTGLTSYGMSFGVGIPVTIIRNSNTNINFGANLGNLGTTENGLIQEKYVGLFFGLSITPGNGDLWFIKRKYD